MHGLINKAIERFVRDTCGDPDWDRIVAAAGLEYSGFEAMLRYDPAVTVQVLAAASEVLARPPGDILEDIGTYLVSNPNVEALRRLLRFGGADFVEFLHSLDDLPDRARMAVSDLDLPDIELREHAVGRFSLICRSEQPGFGHVLVGVLRAMADDYGALVLLEHHGRHAGTETVSIVLIEHKFAQGRNFCLGAGAS
ncbi:heme NO-binding protein [Sulfitobacter sp. JL08]|uniref:heme NO-binding domain-containing protein n=1 Tax=Sulfitobacter sp. JL08 TaxID=2070369 RepID=UPI000E0AF73C|nr:heme NO-binding domain-containing protein [Sulfitobacter sp. JL08]AXI55577.1 heme NO-binding protein [Sulfitobacter sp. JL08]